MALIEVHSPAAHTRTTHYPLAPRPDSLSGRRIGWCDNLKANAGSLLESAARLLRGRGTTFETVTVSKNATAAAPPDVLAHLRTCDAVVLAIAD